MPTSHLRIRAFPIIQKFFNTLDETSARTGREAWRRTDTVLGGYKTPRLLLGFPRLAVQALSPFVFPSHQSFILRPGAFLRPVIFITLTKSVHFIMFAKASVFFFALATFANAAPVKDYCTPYLFSVISSRSH